MNQKNSRKKLNVYVKPNVITPDMLKEMKRCFLYDVESGKFTFRRNFRGYWTGNGYSFGGSRGDSAVFEDKKGKLRVHFQGKTFMFLRVAWAFGHGNPPTEKHLVRRINARRKTEPYALDNLEIIHIELAQARTKFMSGWEQPHKDDDVVLVYAEEDINKRKRKVVSSLGLHEMPKKKKRPS